MVEINSEININKKNNNNDEYNNRNNNEINDNEILNNKPSIKKETKDMFYTLIDSVKNKKNRNLNIGVLRFTDVDGNVCIHCPLKKIKNNGNIIKVGVCKTFSSVIDSVENRKLLTIHKFKDHYNCRAPDHDAIQLRLNTKKSFEEVLNIYKLKDEKKKKKIF